MFCNDWEGDPNEENLSLRRNFASSLSEINHSINEFKKSMQEKLDNFIKFEKSFEKTEEMVYTIHIPYGK